MKGRKTFALAVGSMQISCYKKVLALKALLKQNVFHCFSEVIDKWVALQGLFWPTGLVVSNLACKALLAHGAKSFHTLEIGLCFVRGDYYLTCSP